MQPVANTPEILYYKVTNKGVDDVWVQWAIDMLEAGFDTEHLRILAGEMKPFNQWYLDALTDKVFEELGIEITDIDAIRNTYKCFIIDEALNDKRSYERVLYDLHNFAQDDDDDDNTLFDFYLLYFAMQDLKHHTEQPYWYNANRANIKDIIFQHFEKWRNTHCSGINKNDY